jgi:ribosomal protein S18 acetylase RimI-like enzyme
MSRRLRVATVDDAALIAPMNAQLIRDEGHRNSMSIEQLSARMSTWLQTEYRALVLYCDTEICGYLLYRVDQEYVYIRHLFIKAEYRRQGFGQYAVRWLQSTQQQKLRIDVLVGNLSGQQFWQALGFQNYCITMELNDLPQGSSITQA